MGFPFDPTVNVTTDKVTSFDKPRFLGQIINMNKYFAPNETLIASELWDMLSGSSETMEQILAIINAISTTEFLEKYRYLNENSNRTKGRYKDILCDWFLVSELELIEKNDEIQSNISNRKKLRRCFNKTVFDSKGKYNLNRYIELKDYITHNQ